MPRAIHTKIFDTSVSLHTEIPGKLQITFLDRSKPSNKLQSDAVQDDKAHRHAPKLFKGFNIIVDTVQSTTNWAKSKIQKPRTLPAQSAATFPVPAPNEEEEEIIRQARLEAAGIKVRDFCTQPDPIISPTTTKSLPESTIITPPSDIIQVDPTTTTPLPESTTITSTSDIVQLESCIPAIVDVQFMMARYSYILLMATRKTGVFRQRRPIPGYISHRVLSTGLATKANADELWLERDWREYHRYDAVCKKWKAAHPHAVCSSEHHPIWSSGYPWVPMQIDPSINNGLDIKIAKFFFKDVDNHWNFRFLGIEERRRLMFRWYRRVVALENARHFRDTVPYVNQSSIPWDEDTAQSRKRKVSSEQGEDDGRTLLKRPKTNINSMNDEPAPWAEQGADLASGRLMPFSDDVDPDPFDLQLSLCRVDAFLKASDGSVYNPPGTEEISRMVAGLSDDDDNGGYVQNWRPSTRPTPSTNTKTIGLPAHQTGWIPASYNPSPSPSPTGTQIHQEEWIPGSPASTVARSPSPTGTQIHQAEWIAGSPASTVACSPSPTGSQMSSSEFTPTNSIMGEDLVASPLPMSPSSPSGGRILTPSQLSRQERISERAKSPISAVLRPSPPRSANN